MTTQPTALVGARIFDGTRLQSDKALVLDGAQVASHVAVDELPRDMARVDLGGGILGPGFVDLQVNGGGGVMLNDAPTPETLERIAEAHLRLGVTSFLPTLITDTADQVARAIAAVAACRHPSVAGLHLEGPHLSVARKGAHDAGMIRTMTGQDLSQVLEAARALPCLKITVAPESVTRDQIAAMAEAGILVSLGHSDASFEDATAAFQAGARCATHLFNAMSPLASRAPGLVGAALARGAASAGVIADGVHVHPESLRLALAAKAGPGALFLVSDAMAVAGTVLDNFTLNGRKVRRADGRLTLEDGTLAGADLDLLTAVRNIVEWGLAPVERALAMATSVPAHLAFPTRGAGVLASGAPADMVHLADDLRAIKRVWQGGREVTDALG